MCHFSGRDVSQILQGLKCHCVVLKLLEVAAIVGRQSHSSFDREFLHQVHGITRFGLLAIIRSYRD